MLLEPLYVQRQVLEVSVWALLPSWMNFMLTYGHDWGQFSGTMITCVFLLMGWYFDIMAFTPFLLASCGYERLVRKIPWMKNIYVAMMYVLNFVVLPWYIESLHTVGSFPIGFTLAYFLRVVAFEIHDDILDWNEDRKTGRTTMAMMLGVERGKTVVLLLLILSMGTGGWSNAAGWCEQTLLDILLMVSSQQFAWGRGWIMCIRSFQ